jgi:hypothetical protein
MAEGCQTTVVGVDDRSLMVVGYLQNRRQKRVLDDDCDVGRRRQVPDTREREW